MAPKGRICKRCRTFHSWRYTYCQACKVKLPARRKPAHRKALDLTYDEYVARFGELCGICGQAAKAGGKRLHRDHDHRTGRPRGLLCFRDNAALRSYMTADWLERALSYVRRSAALPKGPS